MAEEINEKHVAQVTEDDKAAPADWNLRDVLPNDPRPWYKQRHLLLLNLGMIIPALSSTTNGYDGSMLNGELLTCSSAQKSGQELYILARV